MVENEQSIGIKSIDTILTFNAKSVDPNILEQLLFGRKELVDVLHKKIISIVKNKSTMQVQIIGKRGMGKSHITAVLYNRIQPFIQKNQLKVAYLSEEEYGIASYLDVLIRIIQAFIRWDESSKEEFEKQFDVLRETHPVKQEEFAEQIILNYIKDKPLLIFIENLDDIFCAIKVDGQNKLRAFLYRNPKVSILATSQALSQDIGVEEKPFFGFFENIYLKNLNFEEALDLLKEIAKIEKQENVIKFLEGKGKSYVRAIQELVKGNHRLLVRFYEFLKVDTMAELSVIFMKTINELKPYFESFIRPLPPLEQKILYHLAFQRIPQKGTDIAKDCFIDTTSLSKKLSELHRRKLIDAIQDPKSKRDKRYEISDPMLRIALAANENKDGFAGIVIDMLALWYSTTELKSQKSLLKENGKECHLRDLALQRKAEIMHIYFSNNDVYEEVQECIENNNINEAKAILEKMPNEKRDSGYYFFNGYVLMRNKKYNESIDSFKKSIKMDSNRIETWINLGTSYALENKDKEALSSYKKALKISPNHSGIWNNLGNTYSVFKDPEKAIECYKKSIELDPNKFESWYNLGDEYFLLNDYLLAFSSYNKAINLNIESNDELIAHLIRNIFKYLSSKPNNIDEYTSITKIIESSINYDKKEGILMLLNIFNEVNFKNNNEILLELPKELREFFEQEILNKK